MKFPLKAGILAAVLTFFHVANSNSQIDNNRFLVNPNLQSLVSYDAYNTSPGAVRIWGKNAPCIDFSTTFDLPKRVGATSTLEHNANCDALAFSNSGGLIKEAHTINFQDAGGMNSDSDTTVSTYPLLVASLNVSPIPGTNAPVGQTYKRDVVIAPTGNGSTERFAYYVTVGQDDNNTRFNL